MAAEVGVSTFAIVTTAVLGSAEAPTLADPALPVATVQVEPTVTTIRSPELITQAWRRERRARIGGYMVATSAGLIVASPVLLGVGLLTCGIASGDIEGCALPILAATGFTVLGSLGVGVVGASVMWVAGARAEHSAVKGGLTLRRRLNWGPAVVGFGSLGLIGAAFAFPNVGTRNTVATIGGIGFLTGTVLGLVQVFGLRDQLPKDLKVGVAPSLNGASLIVRF